MTSSDLLKNHLRNPPTEKANCQKLTYEEQLTIIQMIATYWRSVDIIKKMKEKYGKVVTDAQVVHYRYYPTWQPKIEEFRKEFESKILEEEYASKRVRIQELSKIYDEMRPQAKHKMNCVTVLANIREEVEGKTASTMSLTQYNQYNGLSDEELRRVIEENNNFLKITESKKTIEAQADGS